MKVNMKSDNSTVIDALCIGDCFTTLATSEDRKGLPSLYIKIDAYAFYNANKNCCYAVNLSTGHVRKFALDFSVVPCFDACVSMQ